MIFQQRVVKFGLNTKSFSWGAESDSASQLLISANFIYSSQAYPLHRCNELSVYGSAKEERYGTLKDYVNIIRGVAEYYSIPVLDLYASSGLQPEVREIKYAYILDGLHPNDLGHQVIAYKLE